MVPFHSGMLWALYGADLCNVVHAVGLSLVAHCNNKIVNPHIVKCFGLIDIQFYKFVWGAHFIDLIRQTPTSFPAHVPAFFSACISALIVL